MSCSASVTPRNSSKESRSARSSRVNTTLPAPRNVITVMNGFCSRRLQTRNLTGHLSANGLSSLLVCSTRRPGGPPMPQNSLRRAERVSAILERLADQGSVDAGRIATEFGVSAATIRRDLQVLEDQKLLSRTHGGAVAVDVSYELPVRYRTGQHREEKTLVAQRAAALLPRGPLTLGLTGGTTTHLLARLLAQRVDLTVVTNALNIAAEL